MIRQRLERREVWRLALCNHTQSCDYVQRHGHCGTLLAMIVQLQESYHFPAFFVEVAVPDDYNCHED